MAMLFGREKIQIFTTSSFHGMCDISIFEIRMMVKSNGFDCFQIIRAPISGHRRIYQNYEQSQQKLGIFLENKMF